MSRKPERQRTVLVCTRRRDLPTPPVQSRLGRCGLCESRVWVSASSPKADEVWCVRCAMDMAEPGDKAEPLTERQIADIKKAMRL